MIKVLPVLLVGGFSALSGAVFAADLVTPAPPESTMTAATAFDWTGFYAGAQAGYAWGSATAPWSLTPGGPYLLLQNPANQSGFLGGVQAGYNSRPEIS
jgi:outer membrane immunogenic protein